MVSGTIVPDTNRLLRQYLAKTGHLATFDQAALDAIAARLNGRPREVLGWRTPAEALADCRRSDGVPQGILVQTVSNPPSAMRLVLRLAGRLQSGLMLRWPASGGRAARRSRS